MRRPAIALTFSVAGAALAACHGSALGVRANPDAGPSASADAPAEPTDVGEHAAHPKPAVDALAEPTDTAEHFTESLDSATSPDGIDGPGETRTGIVVTGTIVDTFRLPVAGWLVALGGTSTSTDAGGRFTFTDVTPPYDVAFLYPGIPRTSAIPEVWVYRGLTRPDPTLQPMRAAGPHRRDLFIERINVPPPPLADGAQASVTLGISLGSTDVAMSGSASPTGGLSFGGIHWFGSPSLAGKVHGLAWLAPAAIATNGRENQYLAYAESPLTLVESSDLAAQRVTLDFTANPIATADFRVDVRSGWGGPGSITRSLDGAVVFDSNASLWVVATNDTVRDPAATSAFAPIMPTLPGSDVVFVATQRAPGGHATSFGAAHSRAHSGAVSLAIPEPRKLIAPQESASDVDARTTFEWSAGPEVSILSVRCDAARIGINTVTLASTTQLLPSFPALGMSLPDQADCLWHVDVHGAYATLDEAAGAHGMIDPCNTFDQCERANLLGDGSLTVSEWRAVKLH
jgi:hypothetical protein